MGKFIDQEIGLILGIAIGLWGGTGDFFVVHCVLSSVIVLFVGCWLFVVDLKLVCTRWSDRFLFLFSARMGGLGQIC